MAQNVRTALEVRAEVLKVARLLPRDPAELEYLEQVPPGDLRLLREQVTEVLFTAQGQALNRLAAASKLLPIRVVAAIGERAFGPVLSARIAGLLESERAVEMAKTMPIGFLADVAVELDPRRASAVISGIPPQRIAEITSELLRRGEYVTMGRFVGHLGDDALGAAVREMDDRAMLRVAFVLESKDSLEHLVGLLPQQQLDTIIEVAAREDLWVEVLDLLSHLSERRRADLVQRAGSLNDGALRQLVQSAAANGLMTDLLPLVGVLPLESQKRLAHEVAQLDPSQRQLIEECVRDAGMEQQLALIEHALRARAGT